MYVLRNINMAEFGHGVSKVLCKWCEGKKVEFSYFVLDIKKKLQKNIDSFLYWPRLEFIYIRKKKFR